MKAGALRGALSDRARHGRIHVVTGFIEGTTPSTKSAVRTLSRLGIDGKTLVIAERSDDLTWKSLRKAVNVHLLDPGQLNTYDVINNDVVVFTETALSLFVGRALPNTEVKAVLRGSDSSGEPVVASSTQLVEQPGDVPTQEPQLLDLDKINDTVVHMLNIRTRQGTDRQVRATAFLPDDIDAIAIEQHDTFVLASWPTHLSGHQALTMLLSIAKSEPDSDQVTFYADTDREHLKYVDGEPIETAQIEKLASDLTGIRLELSTETLVWRTAYGEERNARFIAMEHELGSVRLHQLLDGSADETVARIVTGIFGDGDRWVLRSLDAVS
jgi:ribosomal L4/L1-like protein